MLITFTDVISCENPECRDFARIVPDTYGIGTYYCPICGKISRARTVDTALVTKPQQYETYLRKQLQLENQAFNS